jgi:hypothetical protein
MLSREFDGKSREQIIEIALSPAPTTPTVPTPVIWAATVGARPSERLVYADDSFESPCRAWE